MKKRGVRRRYNNQENQIKETTEKDVEKTVESMIQKRIDDYPKLNLEYEKSVIRKREDAPENVLILRNNIF